MGKKKQDAKTLLFDFSIMRRFSRIYAKYIFLSEIYKKYNNVLTEDDRLLLLGLLDAIIGEAKGVVFEDPENYKTMKMYCENTVKEYIDNYKTRGTKLWQKKLGEDRSRKLQSQKRQGKTTKE